MGSPILPTTGEAETIKEALPQMSHEKRGKPEASEEIRGLRFRWILIIINSGKRSYTFY